jgi:hypothetical protein
MSSLRVWVVVCTAATMLATPASAQWTCDLSRPVTGGQLNVRIEGEEMTVNTVSGAIELSTARVAPPLGLRDGTFLWNREVPTIAANGAIFGLQFNANLPLSDAPAWGAGAGALVPEQLSILLPELINPLGGPVVLSGITLISGNGIYHTNNAWRARGAEGVMLLSNTPEPLSLVYSRELLQLVSTDPNEPLSVFVTPAIQAPADAIASFHSGGLLETPRTVGQILDEFVASNGNCPTPASGGTATGASQ